MSPLELALISALLCVVSGIPGFFSMATPQMGRRIAYGINSVAAVFGLSAAAIMLFYDGQVEILQTLWETPLGALFFRLDPLSAFFLIPVLIVTTCISLYGCGYHHENSRHRQRGDSLLNFYLGLAAASIIMLILSAGGITFLIFWEAMTIASFMAICLEHGKHEVREAGLQYLIASHIAIVFLFIALSILSNKFGTTFPVGGSLDPTTPAALLVLLTALIGFGIKSGIMPLHVWLPAAHANAPSHISALLSGVVLKMGIYGLVRTISFYSAPPTWWGLLILGLGMLSAVIGVLFAIGQHDIKRTLAYHSIENIGIIFIGIGVALIGLSGGNKILFILGMSGALLHVLNHALFKSLLFLGSGIIVRATGTREIDKMGGLSKTIPITSAMFLIGSTAICGLPPLNGFVSEFLIYLGIFQGFIATSGSSAAFLGMAAPSLALTGALAVACFVKVFGTTFLGQPRTPTPPYHEHPATSTAMGILAGLCLVIGVFPYLMISSLERVVSTVYPQINVPLPSIQTTAHFYGLSIAAAILVLTIILIGSFFINRLRSIMHTETNTWDCGYASPSCSMQYTASSFAAMLVSLFSFILRPTTHSPDICGLFPEEGKFESHVPEVVLEKGIIPAFRNMDKYLSLFRRLQSGQLNQYILYLFIALIVMLAMSDFL